MFRKLIFINLLIFLVKTGYAQSAAEWVQSGNNKMEEGNMLGAIKDYTSAIGIDPNYAEAYLGRGSVYGELLSFPEAYNDINSALSLKPTLVDAYFNRGFLYYLTRDYNNALKDFNRYLSANLRILMDI